MEQTETMDLCIGSAALYGGLSLTDVKEGDVLVVNLSRLLSTEVRDRMEADLGARILDRLGRRVSVLALDPDVSISGVLRGA